MWVAESTARNTRLPNPCLRQRLEQSVCLWVEQPPFPFILFLSPIIQTHGSLRIHSPYAARRHHHLLLCVGHSPLPVSPAEPLDAAHLLGQPRARLLVSEGLPVSLPPVPRCSLLERPCEPVRPHLRAHGLQLLHRGGPSRHLHQPAHCSLSVIPRALRAVLRGVARTRGVLFGLCHSLSSGSRHGRFGHCVLRALPTSLARQLFLHRAARRGLDCAVRSRLFRPVCGLLCGLRDHLVAQREHLQRADMYSVELSLPLFLPPPCQLLLSSRRGSGFRCPTPGGSNCTS